LSHFECGFYPDFNWYNSGKRLSKISTIIDFTKRFGFSLIILYGDLSRLGRNAIDAGYYIEKFLPAKGARFIAVTDNYDSLDPNSNSIILSLKNMINETYALDIARKVRQAKRLNAQKGLFIGPRAPFGYVKCPLNRHRLIIDPVNGPVVRRIFEMAALGNTVSQIALFLCESGIHMHRNSIYRILKHRVYCGDMVQSGFIAEDTHEAIISRELFAEANGL
jgi:DNA invertase Pin-like site-specific DNA recombinase